MSSVLYTERDFWSNSVPYNSGQTSLDPTVYYGSSNVNCASLYPNLIHFQVHIEFELGIESYKNNNKLFLNVMPFLLVV